MKPIYMLGRGPGRVTASAEPDAGQKANLLRVMTFASQQYRAARVRILIKAKRDQTVSDFDTRRRLDRLAARAVGFPPQPGTRIDEPAFVVAAVDGVRAVVAPNAPNATPSDHERATAAA